MTSKLKCICFSLIASYSFFPSIMHSQGDKAERFIHEKNYKKAIEIYEKLQEEEPEEVDHFLKLASIYQAIHRKKDAIYLYQEALSLQPDRNDIKIALSFAYLSDNQLELSQELLRALLENEPDNSKVLSGLGLIALKKDQLEEAEAYLQKAQQLDPNDSATLLLQANLELKQKNPRSLYATSQRLIELEPENPFVQELLPSRDDLLIEEEKALLKENRVDEAISVYLILVQASPNNVDYLIELARLYRLQGDNASALVLLRKALELDPERQDIRVMLAYTYLFLNELEISEVLFQEVLRVESDNSDSLAGLGRIAFIKKQFRESENLYDRALVINPENETALEFLALLKLQQGQYSQALNLYEGLLKRGRENVDYLMGFGRSLWGLDQKKEALYYYEEALRLDPKKQEARVAVAYVFLFDGELEIAEPLFEVVLENEPDNVEALAGLGNIMARRKNYEDALSLLQKALSIDPNNYSALEYLADVLVRQKRYNEANEIFQKLFAENPNNADVNRALFEIKLEMLAIKGQSLIREKRFDEAFELYQKLHEAAPKNADYLAALGNLYGIKGDRELKIKLLNQALQFEPDRQDIKVTVAFAYLFEKNLELSLKLFQSVLAKEPKNPDALAGFGRILSLNDDNVEAENYYLRALSLDPKNTTALEFLALLKLQQKKYDEALALYARLLKAEPTNKDYQEGFAAARELPLFEKARKLREQKDYEGAIAIVEDLLAKTPQKIEYRLLLGNLYANAERKDEAIQILLEGLAYKADDKDLMRAIGYLYLNKALNDIGKGPLVWDCHFPFAFCRKKINFYYSKEFFEAVLSQDPLDVEALSGRGRLELLAGYPNSAESYYRRALEEQPENITALSFLASLQSMQKKYFTADRTYHKVFRLDPNNQDVRHEYRDFLNIRRPFIDIFPNYEEENEKDRILDEWAARLKNYGVGAALIFPVCDRLKVAAGFSQDYIVLENLLNGTTNYSLDIARPKLGFIWNYTPYMAVSGGLSFAFFSQYHDSTFFTRKGRYCLPYMNFYYNKNFHTFFIETIGDAPIVARNFVSIRSTLIARQFFNAFYEYDFTKRRVVGALATYACYYNSIKSNQYQFGSVWVQTTPPCYYENISLRYQLNYGRFNDLTIDYYTYRPQVSHWLKLDLTKKWGYRDQLITEAGVAHCWQRSFEQGQIITIVPVPFFHWVHREINAAYARVKFLLNDCVNMTLFATYSHDNFDYTTASIASNIHIRF